MSGYDIRTPACVQKEVLIESTLGQISYMKCIYACCEPVHSRMSTYHPLHAIVLRGCPQRCMKTVSNLIQVKIQANR